MLANKICVEVLCEVTVMEDCNKELGRGFKWGSSRQIFKKVKFILRSFYVCDFVSTQRHCMQELLSIA